MRFFRFAGLFVLAALGRATDRLSIGINQVPPLAYWDAQGGPAGFAVEVFQEAARREGIHLEWQPLGDSPSMEAALRRGTLDMTPSGFDTPERRREFYVSAPWWISEMNVIVPAASPLSAATHLRGKRLATTSPALAPTLQPRFPGAGFLFLFPAEAALHAVCGGQADAVALSVMDLNRVLMRRPPGCENVDFRAVSTGVMSELCIVARRGVEPLARRLRQRIDELTVDGTLTASALRNPPVPARSAVLLAQALSHRYQHRVWVIALIFVVVLLVVSGWLIHSLSQDVAARRRAQRELEKSEDRLARAHRIARLGHWEIDPATGSADWSKSAREIACIGGAGPTEWQELLTAVSPEDRERVRAAFLETTTAGEPLTLDYWLLHPDGTRRFVRQHAEAVRAETGALTRVVGTVQDITDYKRLEEQFLQAQKLESLGQLAGGVAHDFNNLLTVINGYAGMVMAGMPESDPLRTYAAEIRQAGERAVALTSHLLTFSRRQPVKLLPLDLNAVVRDAGRMFQRLIGEKIEIETALQPDLRLVKADAGQINQLLINLVVNARDAMPNGGRIRIATTTVDVDESPARHHPDATAGPHVRLTVADNGAGMSEEVKKRIFEPFFTTKPKGGGTGLGLSTVYGIVRQSGGWISVESQPGKGTTFDAFFPLTPEASADVPPLPAAMPAPRGSETLLVAEDQSEVRKVAARVLRRQGYQVLEAGSGDQALEVLRAWTGPLDLLITDVVMPGISCQELVGQARSVRPGMAVLLISGYSEDTQEIQASGIPYLPKPFAPEALVRKAREVLDQARGGGNTQRAGG